MKEHPILFSGPMVKAILDGQKTQTRRVVTPQPVFENVPGMGEVWTWQHNKRKLYRDSETLKETLIEQSPYKPGDRLWVREATYWPPRESMNFIHYAATPRIAKGRFHKDGLLTHFYGIFDSDEEQVESLLKEGYKKRPSIFMPRFVCRIDLEIIGIGAEQVLAISTQDAIAEGITIPDHLRGMVRLPHGGAPVARTTYVTEFSLLWDKINESRGYGWNANPWIRVIEFRRA